MLDVESHYRFSKYIVSAFAVFIALGLLYGIFSTNGFAIGMALILIPALMIFTTAGFIRKGNKDHPDGGGQW